MSLAGGQSVTERMVNIRMHTTVAHIRGRFKQEANHYCTVLFTPLKRSNGRPHNMTLFMLGIWVNKDRSSSSI